MPLLKLLLSACTVVESNEIVIKKQLNICFTDEILLITIDYRNFSSLHLEENTSESTLLCLLLCNN